MKRILIAATAACLAMPALAHVTLERPETAAGQGYKAVLRIGHGCEGSPTTSVSVEIPVGLAAVKPMPKAGWTLKTERGAHPRPITVHGKPETEGTKRITWSGGKLPDAEYDEFIFVSQIAPDVSGPLHFPVVQMCEKGEHRWTEIPAAGQSARDLAAPAPVLRVAASEPKAAQSAPVRVESAWSRATPGGATIGGGYLRVVNTGATADRLTGGSTDVAKRIEVHEMSMDNGVMKMRNLPKGLEIPAGGSIDLKPGGYHLMLMDLKSGLKDGDTFTATLHFEKAGAVPVTFSVHGMGAAGPASAPAASGHQHQHHH